MKNMVDIWISCSLCGAMSTN